MDRAQRLEKRTALKAQEAVVKDERDVKGAEEPVKKNETESAESERAKLSAAVGEAPAEKAAREARIVRMLKDTQAIRIRENKRKPRYFGYEAQEKDYNVDFGRKIIVLPLPSRGVWFDNTKIAFFKSTGTSNEGFEFLEGTYFPTLGIINKSDTRRGTIPFIDEIKGDGTVAVKTNFFKTLFTGKKSQEITNTPVWLYDLITEYCQERYPTLFDIDYGEFRVDESNVEMASEKEQQLIEIEHLYRILKSYFTADWQVSQSIGLSRFMGEGIWIGEMRHFAEFMDTKIKFTLSGYRGPEVEGEDNTAKAIKFLQDNDAQSELQFTQEDALENSLTTPLEYYVFSGVSTNRLQQDMRAFRNAARFKRKGGTKRHSKRRSKRSVKTRHQKRR